MNNTGNGECSNQSQSNQGSLTAYAGAVTRPSTDVELLEKIAHNEMQDKKREEVKAHIKTLIKRKASRIKDVNDAEVKLKEAMQELNKFRAMNLDEAYESINSGKSSQWFVTTQAMANVYDCWSK